MWRSGGNRDGGGWRRGGNNLRLVPGQCWRIEYVDRLIQDDRE
jgi:hypothetical protein